MKKKDLNELAKFLIFKLDNCLNNADIEKLRTYPEGYNEGYIDGLIFSILKIEEIFKIEIIKNLEK